MGHITHGIPAHLRKEDEEGNLYSLPGSDGCDYVHAETHELIPHASFYTEEVHNAKMVALSGDQNVQGQYNAWFNNVVEQLPGVHHYSWFDIERKIMTYKNYWSKHWQSLYNIEQEDTAENNMFFDKPWSEVSEDEVRDMALKLSNEMGGWVFHQKVDFSKPTPHVMLERSEPALMNND